MTFSTAEKLKAVERELALRKRVYPNRVMNGRMSEKEALYQQQIFEAILDDYKQQAQKERLL